MTYFKNIQSLENLKNQFKVLARKNHPDAGGDVEVMKAVNSEYDQLFPIWKHKYNQTAATPTTETADGTRSEFYTQSGWKGSKHDWNRSTKEVAVCIRTYVKEIYPTYKFSVRFSSASMCSEIHVDLKEAPQEIYKDFSALSHDELMQTWRKAEYNRYMAESGCLDDKAMAELEDAYDSHKFMKVFTDAAQAVIADVNREVKSYNFEDCDGMIDYFHVDFYYFGCGISDDFKVVAKTARVKNKPAETAPATIEAAEQDINPDDFEISEDVHTQTGEKLFVVKIKRSLTRDEYLKVAEQMKAHGGYYSKYKHGFVFREDPSGKFAA